MIAVLASLVVGAAGAAPRSGPQPGATVASFDVVDVSGPHKGERLCYVCSYGYSPVVVGFVRGEPAQAAELVARVQALANQHRAAGLKAFVVFIGGRELRADIARLAAERRIQIPLVYLPNGDPPRQFRIDPRATNTFVTYVRNRVTANQVDVTAAQFEPVANAARRLLD